MSYEASAWAVKQRVGDPSAKLLLLTLAEAAGLETQDCFLKIKTLADRAECSEDTVRRKLKILEERGFITIAERRDASGSKTSNLYTMLIGGTPQSAGRGAPPQRAGEAPPHVAPLPPPQPAGVINQSLEPVIESKPSGGAAVPAAEEAEKPKSDGRHKTFIDAWGVAFEAQFREPYRFAGGRDARAVKQLILTTGMSNEDILEVAKCAWRARLNNRNWGCKQAVTIHGLDTQWTKIRQELKDARIIPASRQENTQTRCTDGLE